jgi:hypothetical protein
MKTILFAPVYSRSGYGDHAREVADFLISQKEITLEIAPVSWGKNPDSYYTHDNESILNINERIITSVSNDEYDCCVTIGMPTEFKELGKYNIGITAGIETNRVSREFVHHVNKMDLLIVPSTFTRKTFESTEYINDDQVKLKTECEIVVINEYTSEKFYKRPLKKTDFLSEIKEDFCFLSVGQWISSENDDGGRKNMKSLINTFITSFEGNDIKPALVLKTNGCNYNTTDRHDIENTINEIVGLYDTKTRPNIYLIHGNLNDNDLFSLYNNNKIKAFLSHTRGEGFGRPMLEASLSELPIICPKFSGYLDFLNEDNSTLITGKLVNVNKVDTMFCENAKWIDIDEESSANAMKKIYTQYSKYKNKAIKETTGILTSFSRKSAMQKYKQIFENIHTK